MTAEPLITAQKMTAKDGTTLGWYFCHPEFYCDFELENGVWSVYFRDRTNQAKNSEVYAETTSNRKAAPP
jgi:hypothetical protein